MADSKLVPSNEEKIKGLVALKQIESGKNLYNDVAYIKKKLELLNAFRRKTDYITEADLDPSIKFKIDELLNKYDNLKVLDGINHEGIHYQLDEILNIVLDNKDIWSSSFDEDLLSVVNKI